MKFLIFLSTRLRVFLTEVPPIILLTVAICYNDAVDTPFKLYPLMVVLSALIIFIPIYFLRGVLISYEEVRCVGWFSRREKAIIKEDRTLVLTILKKRRVRIELFGKNDDGESSYAWLANETPVDINLYRSKVNGSLGVAKRILRYFEADDETIEKALQSDDFSAELEKIKVMTEIENESKKIAIYFKETL